MQHVFFWLIVVLALNTGGFMAVDGTRALLKGDYITPKSGAHAGQLGPWSNVVKLIGIEPRSTLMKCIFVSYGLAWIVVIACFALRIEWAWIAMLVAAISALWYLPFGTLCSALVIILLLLPSVRDLFASGAG